jgi:membrane protein DedA with SNARE-associated domain
METGFDWIVRHGYGAIFVLLLLGIVGLPVPDETLLVFAGYLSFKGTLRLEPTVATAFLGSACGISVSYAIGRFLGLPALTKFGPLLRLRPEHLEQAHQWMERWGKYSLLLAYFIPGYRHLAAFMVGTSRLEPTVFARFAYTGALIWTTCFVGLGYAAGEQWQQLIPLLHNTLRTTLLVGLIVLAGLAGWLLLRRSRL